MSYESIANLVHDLVKNPRNMLPRQNILSSTQINKDEFAIIQTVISRYEVSGNALSIKVIPEGLWG